MLLWWKNDQDFFCYFARMKTEFAAVETGVTLTFSRLYKRVYVISRNGRNIIIHLATGC